MNLNFYIAFVVAAGLLIVVPGPNILLIVSHSLSYGRRLGFYTVLGTSIAMLVQLVVAVVGLTTTMLLMSAWFEWLRWIGVAYLVYLGWGQLSGGNVNREIQPRPVCIKVGFWQGFFVSLTNPKTMLFFAAFLPQFADPLLPMTHQLVLLAATFWCMAILIDGTYMLLGSRLQSLLDSTAGPRLRGRISGLCLMGAGLGLALVRKQ